MRAHSDNHAQRELQRDAQVAREAERIENGDRAAAGADMLMQKMLLVDCRLKVFCIMLSVPAAAATTFARLRPRARRGRRSRHGRGRAGRAGPRRQSPCAI